MNRHDQLIGLCQDLAMLLNAGTDLDTALQVILDAQQAKQQLGRRWLPSNESFIHALQAVRGQIRQGQRLSASLAQQPRYFDQFFIGMVSSGEASGQLASALNKLADQLEASKALRAQVTTALIYPTILTVVMALGLVVVLALVLPKLAPLFAAQGSELSLSASMLLSVGEWFNRWGLHALGVLFLSVLALILYQGESQSELQLGAALARLPGIRSLYEQIEFSRFTASLAHLLEAGVLQAEAVSIATSSLSSTAHRRAMQEVIRQINDGRRLSEAMAVIPAFSAIYAHSVYSGEASGQLAKTLHALATRQQQKFAQKTQRLLAILEPALVVIFGVVIGFIAVTVFASLQSISAFPS